MCQLGECVADFDIDLVNARRSLEALEKQACPSAARGQRHHYLRAVEIRPILQAPIVNGRDLVRSIMEMDIMRDLVTEDQEHEG